MDGQAGTVTSLPAMQVARMSHALLLRVLFSSLLEDRLKLIRICHHANSMIREQTGESKNLRASERNAKMGETYARARTQAHTHTRTRIDTKTKAPMHLCVSLTERTDSVGHLNGDTLKRN